MTLPTATTDTRVTVARRKICDERVSHGVGIPYAMHHGGPFPAASLPHFTSIGMGAMKRFVRPLCYQDVPDELLPRSYKIQSSWADAVS